MTDPAALPFPMATLLAERPWVRGVARALVRDDAAADDLAQDAWVAALTHEGAPPHAPRAWLATVLRRGASKGRRTERRRDARERLVARPEAGPSTLEVVAQAEWHQRVVNAVLALPEPYRTALLLRFFEDLPPREVALRTGAPVATVRSRVQRGLERLRAEFDRGHGGDRRAWAGSLVALAGTGAVPGFASGGAGGVAGVGAGVSVTGAAHGAVRLGGAIMATKGKSVLVAAIVALMGGGAWWFLRSRDDGRSGPGSNPSMAAAADKDAPPPGLAAAGGTGTGPLAVVGPNDGQPPAPQESSTTTVRPEVRFRSGSLALSTEEARLLYATAGVEPTVVLVAEDDLSGGTPARTYARRLRGETQSWQRSGVIDWAAGEASIATAVEPGRWWAVVSRPGLPPAFVRASVSATRAVSFEVDLRPSGRATRVRFVDPNTKEPIVGVRVVPYVEFGDDAAFVAGSAVLCNAKGEVDLPLAEPGEDPWRPVSWWAVAAGRAAPVIVSPAVASASTGPVEIPLHRTATVSGKAWRADGRPAVGALVTAVARKGYAVRTTVAADGSYALTGVACSKGAKSREGLGLFADATALDAVSVRVEVSPGDELKVDLGAPADPARKTGVLRGRITAGGVPVVGALLLLKGEGTGETGPDGTFRFEGLRPGPIGLMVALGDPRVSDDALLQATSLSVPEGGGEIPFEIDLPDGVIRVRVVDAATGAPVAGAWVAASPEGAREDMERFPGVNWKIGWSGVADADGIAWMRGLMPKASFTVRVMTPIPRQGTEESAGVVAGTGAAPTEVTLRLGPGGR